MAEQRRPPTEADLERMLIGLAAHLEYPAAPDLAARVHARIMAQAPRPRTTVRWRLTPGRALAAALVAIALCVGAVLLLSPAARTAVADRLGLRGVHITPVASLPPLPQRATPAATPPPPAGRSPTPATGPGAGLHLGEPASLQEASAAVGFHLLAPATSELATPDAVYVDAAVLGSAVSFVFAARPGLPPAAGSGVGLLLTEFRGKIEPSFFGKLAPPDTTIVAVTVNGSPGWWIQGSPHEFFYQGPDGVVRRDSIRLAGNTLLWQQGDLTLRLESALSQEDAIRIAQSVR